MSVEEPNTKPSRYADEVRAIVDLFEHDLCELCGHTLDIHKIAPDHLGHAHLYCLEGHL